MGVGGDGLQNLGQQEKAFRGGGVYPRRVGFPLLPVRESLSKSTPSPSPWIQSQRDISVHSDR